MSTSTAQNSNWFIKHAKKLKEIMEQINDIRPEITNEYRAHTALKLMCVGYWSDIFTTILHSSRIPAIYVDICSGSGLTKIKDDSKLLPGSTIVAESYASYPYKFIICVDCDKTKTNALEMRMSRIRNKNSFKIFNGKIEEVIDDVCALVKQKHGIMFCFIDPEGFNGLDWDIYYKISKCRGDILITWDHPDIWRVFHKSIIDKGNELRMMNIFGNSIWKNAISNDELTERYINRLRERRDLVKSLDIIDENKIVYKELLCVRKTKDGSPWVSAYENNLKKQVEKKDAELMKMWLDIAYEKQSQLDRFSPSAQASTR